MKFRNRIRQRLSINSINPLVVDKNRRELKSIVVDILKTITGVRLYGYRMTPVIPEEDFERTNIDYLHKTKNKKDIYVDMSDDVIDNMEVYFILSEEKVARGTIEVSRANTRRQLNVLPQLEWHDEDIEKEIKEYDLSYLPSHDPKTQESLFVKVNLYIPRLINNVIRLNGNHYFNKFYIQDSATLTRNGKLKCQHPSYVSYMDIDKDKLTFRTNIFKASYNPLLFLKTLNDITPGFRAVLFDGIEDEEQREYFELVLNNTIEDAELQIEAGIDIDNVADSIPASEVLENIYRFVKASTVGSTEDVISLHTSLKGKLRIDVRKGLKILGKKSKRQSLDDYKSKINVDPRTVCTIIKNNKQYALTKSANEIDIWNFFGYVSNIEEVDTIAYDRNFRKEHLGVIDPIATSTSDNVGLAGLLVFSIPDSKLKLSE